MVMFMKDSGFKEKGRVKVFILMIMVKFSMVHGIRIRSMVTVNILTLMAISTMGFKVRGMAMVTVLMLMVNFTKVNGIMISMGEENRLRQTAEYKREYGLMTFFKKVNA